METYLICNVVAFMSASFVKTPSAGFSSGAEALTVKVALSTILLDSRPECKATALMTTPVVPMASGRLYTGQVASGSVPSRV